MIGKYQLIPKMLTTAIRSVILKMKNTNEIKRIEEKFEVQTYLDRLKYAIQSGNGKIHFQKSRVELVSLSCGVGDSYIFVMSFHFAERSFKDSDFPFKK